jgi:hypothetical protein
MKDQSGTFNSSGAPKQLDRVDNIDDRKRRVYRPHMMMNAQESLLRRRAKAPARA